VNTLSLNADSGAVKHYRSLAKWQADAKKLGCRRVRMITRWAAGGGHYVAVHPQRGIVGCYDHGTMNGRKLNGGHLTLTTLATMPRPEFDPTSERHYTVLTVKLVDPGCTLELQLEERDGTVTRLTTGENPEYDREIFRAAAMAAFDRAMLFNPLADSRVCLGGCGKKAKDRPRDANGVCTEAWITEECCMDCWKAARVAAVARWDGQRARSPSK